MLFCFFFFLFSLLKKQRRTPPRRPAAEVKRALTAAGLALLRAPPVPGLRGGQRGRGGAGPGDPRGGEDPRGAAGGGAGPGGPAEGSGRGYGAGGPAEPGGSGPPPPPFAGFCLAAVPEPPGCRRVGERGAPFPRGCPGDMRGPRSCPVESCSGRGNNPVHPVCTPLRLGLPPETHCTYRYQPG